IIGTHGFIWRIDIFARCANPSTPVGSAAHRVGGRSLQELVQFFSQLSPDSLGRSNFLGAGPPESVYRAKFPEENIFSILTDPGAIIQDALRDPSFHQQLMIRICEPVGLIANSLEKS